MLLLTDVYIEEERLYGSLHVTINKLQGLSKPMCKWCRLLKFYELHLTVLQTVGLLT